MKTYLVIERFKPGAARSIYRRLGARGRALPSGLDFVESWVADDLTCCYQLMRTADLELFVQWSAVWQDLCDFEIIPVISSAEAQERALDG